jgi:hypothetical protein
MVPNGRTMALPNAKAFTRPHAWQWESIGNQKGNQQKQDQIDKTN